MSRSIAFSVLALVACGSKPAPTTTTTQPSSAATSDAQKTCVDSFTHNRTCTEQYIPSLVDTRAKLDIPAGIAEKVKQDRDGVITTAKAEWATDSTDEHIAGHCQEMTANMTDDMKPMVDAVRACVAKTDCAEYVACMQPIEEQLIARAPKHP